MRLTLPLKNILVFYALDVPRDVADIMLPIRIAKDLLPQSAGLFEVHCEGLVRHQADGNGKVELTLCNLAQIMVGMTQPLLMLEPLSLVWPRLVLKGRDRARVVGSEPLVVVIPRATPLEVGDRNDRLVDRELLVIHTETMAVSIRVGEQTGLQDRICRWLDTGNKVRGRESSLLNLSEVVLGVLVKNNLPKLAEGEVLMGPDLG